MNLIKSILKGLFKEDFELKDTEIKSLKRSLDNEKNMSKNRDSNIHNLEIMLESLKNDMTAMQNSKTLLEGEKESLQVNFDEISVKLKEEKQKNETLQTRVTNWKKRSDYNKIELEKCKGELNSTLQEVYETNAKLLNLRREYNVLNDRFDNLRSNKNVTISALKTENEDLSDKLTAANSEKEELHAQIESLLNDWIQKVENIEKNSATIIQDKDTQLAKLGSDLHTSRQSSIDKQIVIDKLNARLLHDQNESKKKLADLSLRLNESQASFDEKSRECELLRAELDSAKNSVISSELVQSLQNNISSKQEDIRNLEQKIQSLNEEVSDLKGALEALGIKLRDKEKECKDFKTSLEDMSKINFNALETERLLENAKREIDALQTRIDSLPKEEELVKRDNKIVSLQRKISELNSKLDLQKIECRPEADPVQSANPKSGLTQKLPELESKPVAKTEPEVKPIHEHKPEKESAETLCEVDTKQIQKVKYKAYKSPYITKPPSITGAILKEKNFPKIENDNIYASSKRLIDQVYDCRTDSLVSSDSIFLKWSAEEISKLRFDLDEAIRRNEPYLICPCCRQMVNVSSRRIGFGNNCREVQYFTHAVKNIPCDLKRDYAYSVSIDGIEAGDTERPDYFKELRDEIKDALLSDISVAKGVADVKVSNWIFSEELPIMKRRLADITATYKDHNIVFELVTPTTNSSKLHDRDIFYLINNRQVFWILGLNSLADYNELRRSVAKDIMFTNRCNVFVFDSEAQEETQKRGELILKCNWLVDDNEWFYKVEKNGKNGELISLDQITFDNDSCRPYYFDADEYYFKQHPTAMRPAKLSREELKKSIKETWDYSQSRDKAVKEMVRLGDGVVAFFNEGKWGFRYGSLVFIEPTYTAEPEMGGSYAKVQKDEKYGIVNRFGNIILKPNYELIEIFLDKEILYSNGKEWHIFGIVENLAPYAISDKVKIETISQEDRICHLVIEKHLFDGQLPEEIYFFGDQIFKKDKSIGKWILWSSAGERIINETAWSRLEITSDNKLKLTDGDKELYLSLDGTISEKILEKVNNYFVIRNLPNEYTIIKTFNGYWGVLDDKNEYVVLPRYNIIDSIDNNYLRFNEKGKWGIMTTGGKVLVEAKYLSIQSAFEEGFIVTIANPEKTWETLSGKIDKKGNEITETICEFGDNLRITKSFERFGVESSNGVIVNHVYESLRFWAENKLIAKKGTYFGIIDINDNVLMPFEYSKIIAISDDKAAITNGNKMFHINADCVIIEDEIIDLQKGFKKIKKEGKWGIIAPDGSQLVAPKYDEITSFRGRLIGIINGKLIKLAAYYPFPLQMTGIYNYDKMSNKDIVQVSTVRFQLCPKVNDMESKSQIEIALTNWTYSMKYPVVTLAKQGLLTKKRDYIDRQEDFLIGDTITGHITDLKYKRRKNKSKVISKFIKFANVLTDGGKSIQVHIKDFINSEIRLVSIKADMVLSLTKLGYDEELDRTIWKVNIV